MCGRRGLEERERERERGGERDRKGVRAIGVPKHISQGRRGHTSHGGREGQREEAEMV